MWIFSRISRSLKKRKDIFRDRQWNIFVDPKNLRRFTINQDIYNSKRNCPHSTPRNEQHEATFTRLKLARASLHEGVTWAWLGSLNSHSLSRTSVSGFRPEKKAAPCTASPPSRDERTRERQTRVSNPREKKKEARRLEERAACKRERVEEEGIGGGGESVDRKKKGVKGRRWDEDGCQRPVN